MKRKLSKILLPTIWFLVACSTLIHYERNWDTGDILLEGLAIGILLSVALAIVLVVRLFRMFRTVENTLISSGTIKTRISTPYDMFPVLLLLPFMMGGQSYGELLPSALTNNEVVYQWVFKWGMNEYKFLIYLAILGLLLLYRVYQLLSAVAKQQHNAT